MLDMEEILIPVDAKALQRILEALYGPPHLIRELQATVSLPDNPIEKIREQYNTFVLARRENLSCEPSSTT